MKRIAISLIPLFISCGGNHQADLYNGRLETKTVTVSSETAGTIDSVCVEEGQQVKKNQLLAVIDARRYQALYRQQEARLREAELNRTTLDAQIAQLKSHLDLAEQTLTKTETLVKDGAVTPQSRDELAAQVTGVKAQMEGLLNQQHILTAKIDQLKAAMDIARINLNDTVITSPLDGTLLTVLHQPGETAAPGLALFEIADLSFLEATIYVSLERLPDITIGGKANIFVDGVDSPFEGTIRWIASEAEFTPKTILTKETRTTLVYAVKIRVPNRAGRLKIGMPADVELIQSTGD